MNTNKTSQTNKVLQSSTATTKTTEASKTVTAGVLIIGNEILSGRTLDTNSNTIAKALTAIGVTLMETQVIPDIEDIIIDRVNDYRRRFDYVFTSGGIGPTHDDKTAQAVAAAFETELELNDQAYDILLAHYGAADFNDARKKMAYMPIGAKLIDNPVSAAPGIHMDNVYVMAGIPSILSAMLDSIIPTLVGGAHILSETILCAGVAESILAPDLERIETQYDHVEIGSYPRFKDGKPSLNIVVRSTDATQLKQAADEVRISADKVLQG